MMRRAFVLAVEEMMRSTGLTLLDSSLSLRIYNLKEANLVADAAVVAAAFSTTNVIIIPARNRKNQSARLIVTVSCNGAIRYQDFGLQKQMQKRRQQSCLIMCCMHIRGAKQLALQQQHHHCRREHWQVVAIYWLPHNDEQLGKSEQRT